MKDETIILYTWMCSKRKEKMNMLQVPELCFQLLAGSKILLVLSYFWNYAKESLISCYPPHYASCFIKQS